MFSTISKQNTIYYYFHIYSNRVVIKDGHEDKDVLYGRDKWMDVSYRTDMADLFFEYFLKIHNIHRICLNMLKYSLNGRT
jgi:hypothetical protein